MQLYTIGHGAHSIDTFISLLDENGISAIVDVRTAPYSRYHPQFNKENLAQELPAHLIEYIYAGKYLGGRPKDPSCYKNNKIPEEGADYLHLVNYSEIMKRPWFVQAIHRLLEIADEQTTSILCSEENPANCHRHHLIAKFLIAEYPDVDVKHIRSDGSVYGARSILTNVDEPTAKQLKFFE